MKKIIAKKVYDTSTAVYLAEASSNLSCSDFGYWEETLYRKKNGEMFLHGSGGPASKYAEVVGLNQWSGGQAILPLSYDEAEKWAEEHLPADKYMEIFGNPEPEEGGGNEVITISLSTAAAKKLRQEASKRSCTIGSVITDLLI